MKKFADNEVPKTTEGMYNEILRMKDEDPLIASIMTPENIKSDPLSVFVSLAYVGLRQREMWHDALDDVNKNLTRAAGQG